MYIMVSNTEWHPVAVTMPYRAEETPLRWIVLVCVAFLPAGAHISFSMISGLQSHLMNGRMKLNQNTYGALASCAAWIGMIMPLLGGVLLDVRSVRSIVIIFLTISCIGQIIFSIGVSLDHIITAFTGRIVLGIGEGLLVVAQGSICARWFRTSELTLAIAFTESVHAASNSTIPTRLRGLTLHLQRMLPSTSFS